MNTIKHLSIGMLVALLFACTDSSTNSPISEPVAPSKWLEGTHYTVIENAPASSDKNLKEYFSFWCPHCYRFEPFIQAMSDELPEDIPLIKVHVNFMGFLPSSTQDLGTQALIAARANGTEKAFTAALFNAIHVEQKDLNSLMSFSPIFAQTTSVPVSLSSLLKEDKVKALVEQNNNLVQQMRSQVKSVPALVVNDKYLLDLGAGLNMEEVKQLIIWLSEK